MGYTLSHLVAGYLMLTKVLDKEPVLAFFSDMVYKAEIFPSDDF